MNKRVLIYPFSEEIMPILRHKECFKDIDIVSLASPRGFGLNDKEISTIDGGEENIDVSNISISNSFSEEISKCDWVWFVPFDRPTAPMIDILKMKLNESIQNGKNILWSINEELFDLNEYVELAKENKVNFKVTKVEEEINKNIEEDVLKEISVPIILVCGECDDLNKFEIQLSLRKKLLNIGYSVSQIGSRSYCEVLGFHSFPEFMNENINEEKKIIMFNNFVNNINLLENPDIMIIGVPGGLKPLNKFINNGFGTTLFEISQAITPDMTIVSLLCQDIKSKMINELDNIFKYRFSVPLDYINISNNVFNRSGHFTLDKLNILNCDYKLYRNIIKDMPNKDDRILNILCKNSGDILVNNIIKKLSR